MSRRLLIADDHPLFRVGLRYALRAKGFEVVGEVGNGAEALERCRLGDVEVVLMDVKMPDMDGIEACREIQRLERPPLVIMLTTFEEPAIIKAARDAGAVAYLSKETDPAELATTLEAIIERPDGRWLPRVSVPNLTERESQVLALLAEGCTNKAMARRLDLSPETIKDYLNGVYRKLEVRDRLSALRRAQELGLLP